MLTPATASAYCIALLASEGQTVRTHETRKSGDGITDIIEVDFTIDGVHRMYTMDVWIETRADGSEYLYGEY